MPNRKFLTGYGQGGYGEGFYGGWQGPGIYPPDEYYYGLITSQYQNSPKFMALLQAVMKVLNDTFPVALTLYENFDLDQAVGAQLDVLGTYLGVSRTVGFQPSGVNLIPYTQDFENWTTSQCAVGPDTAIDPLGGNTADTIAPSAGSNNSYIYTTWNPNGRAGQYTFSVWIRSNTPTSIRLNVYANGLGGSPRATKVINVGANWQPQQFFITANIQSSDTIIYLLIGGNFSWGGSQPALIPWGAQFELGTTPSAYVAQFGTPVGGNPVLDDNTYRILLRAKLLWNFWDGRISSLQASWQKLFPGGSIVILDNQNMSITVICTGAFTSIIQDLINNGYIVPRPQGVLLNIQFGSGPFFGFGLNNQYVAGFGVGKFA